MKHVMVDLETMGNGGNAPIIAIGAVKFDITGTKGAPFYANVDLQSCMDVGMECDASTIMWWLEQSGDARERLKFPVPDDVSTVLRAFSAWFGDSEYLWGNGAAFDNVILNNAYRKVGQEPPWNFWNDRCYRTLKSQFAAVPMERVGTHHNAVDDAQSQAEHLIAMCKHYDWTLE
jgi:exodeoxyribonuclease VIII